MTYQILHFVQDDTKNVTLSASEEKDVYTKVLLQPAGLADKTVARRE